LKGIELKKKWPPVMKIDKAEHHGGNNSPKDQGKDDIRHQKEDLMGGEIHKQGQVSADSQVRTQCVEVLV
jgi:hypothetical protein